MAKKQRAVPSTPKERAFHLEFKNVAQKMAWASFQQHDILFLLGPAGCGKSYISVAFAINEILAKRKSRIVLTRPIVEAGESLGYLPGTADAKVAPYMTPLVDSITKLVGPNNTGIREIVNDAIDVRPLAYLRGVSFDNSVCIFDEAQNATLGQLKLFLTRLGENSKMIINGDPFQSDLPGQVALVDVLERLQTVEGIGSVQFKSDSIVRNPLISRILERI